MKIQILPSLLAADMGNLEAACISAVSAGADALHFDIMDGHFVPNISMGPSVVEMAKRCVQTHMSVHLMLSHPDQYINRFVDAGADSLFIHIEASCNVPEALEHIKELGIRPGITLNPETPAEMIFPVMDKVDEVLCMSVHPGYGGQDFMPDVLPKIKILRDYAVSRGMTDLDIMVDGGIDIERAGECAAHGANCFVAGTSLFDSDDMTRDISEMRKTATSLYRE